MLPHEFTKKPVTIWAMKYDGTVKSAHAICAWVGCAGARFGPKKYKQPGSPVWDGTLLQIRTLESGEGYHEVSEGDFVIQGVKGEFYPCKPDIFAATYSSGQSAMNAQERELREALGKVAAILQGCDLETDFYLDSRRPSQRYVKQQMLDWLAEAERLLAERREGR